MLALFLEMTFLDFLFSRPLGIKSPEWTRALRRINLVTAAGAAQPLVNVFFSNGEPWDFARLWGIFIGSFVLARLVGAAVFWRPKRLEIPRKRSALGLTAATVFALILPFAALTQEWREGFAPRTQVKMRHLEESLAYFRLRHGRFPTDAEGLDALDLGHRAVRDAFLRRTRYASRGNGYALLSAGPDLQFDTSDDVSMQRGD